jgi:uncharacterized metal-binding protein YceD (DUF177 family)
MTKQTSHPQHENPKDSSADFATLLSRPFGVDVLEDGPVDLELTANADECAAIARHLHIPRLQAFSAHLHLSSAHGVVGVRGVVKAHLSQICVVTLEPFDSDVESDVAIDFATPAIVSKAEDAWRKRSEDEEESGWDEPPDPIINGQIDLGAVMVEFLALGLDPYPRKEGAVFAGGDESEGQKTSPFAALAGLKDKK